MSRVLFKLDDIKNTELRRRVEAKLFSSSPLRHGSVYSCSEDAGRSRWRSWPRTSRRRKEQCFIPGCVWLGCPHCATRFKWFAAMEPNRRTLST